jgi:hypothetical protein
MRDALLCLAFAGCALMGAMALAQDGTVAPAAAPQLFTPVTLTLEQNPPSVYAPPQPRTEDEMYNAGGVHFDFSLAYFTDYVYRGIERFEPPGAEDRLNLQVEGRATFDTGRFPHPFVDIFVNVADGDPISSFQEIRPTIGFEWTIRPITLSFGHTSYLYPERDPLETNEVFMNLKVDDSYFFSSQQKLLSPYVFGAYDYDKYNGFYVEAGIEHAFEIEGTGLTITAQACIAFEKDILYFSQTNIKDSGFQHYQFGLIGSYSLNKAFNVPIRLGEWSLDGYLYYTDNLEHDLLASTQLWGGAGITFHY